MSVPMEQQEGPAGLAAARDHFDHGRFGDAAICFREHFESTTPAQHEPRDVLRQGERCIGDVLTPVLAWSRGLLPSYAEVNARWLARERTQLRKHFGVMFCVVTRRVG
jgi:hypothetical protein